MNKILVLLFTSLLFSCTQSVTSKAPQRKAANLLEKTYAEFRKGIVSNVKYTLNVDVTQAEKYSGTQRINFDLANPSELTVDFFDGQNLKVTVNGKPITTTYNNFFVTIPQNTLNKGSNTIEIAFDHPYNKTGSGLYRFVDPEDQRAYMYTDFEPYDAHVFMPCFDQPDLKATYTLTTTAPKDWVVVSSTLETDTKTQGENKIWTFPETAKFSTYLFSLHAGPYKVWTHNIVTKNHTIPHRVMARQALAKYVDPNEWNHNIQKGFEFYEAYFDYPYPFKKYDEVIVSDFNSGAMENVAAVTFNENRFVSRTKKTRAESRRLASVQLHELAHMWFGDLVTMKWWNDIWLNESFATYAAFRALDGNTEYKEAGVDFISRDKSRAYQEDQLVTTHPIEFEVADTDVVFANFDGITYGKGASVLKQLNYYLGDEAFKLGLQAYFKKHEFANAELADFMGALEKSSKRSLDEWKKVWLRTAEVNTVRVDYQCENGLTKDTIIAQTAKKDYPTLRPHKAQIGVFSLENNKFQLMKTVDVEYSAESTQVNGMDGLPCDKIALVYPNFMDHDYALVSLDTKSLTTLIGHISKIDDEMLKVGLWSSLWDMVISQKIPATQVFDIILAHADKETSPDVLGTNIGRAFSVAHGFLAKDEKMNAQREKAIARLSDYFLKNSKAAKSVDLQKMWFGSFIGNADTKKDLDMVAGFLQKTPTWLKFPIDQDLRWDIIHQLSSKDYPGFQKLVDAEKTRDKSSQAERSVLAIQASVPKLEVKKEFFAKLTQGPTTEFPLGKIGPVAGSLFPNDQEDLHRQFSAEFFKNLKSLKGQSNEFLSVYVNLSPSFCATESVNQLREFVAANGDLPPRVIKSLKIDAQQSERCVGIRQKILETEANKAI